jgi:hypothetical protein
VTDSLPERINIKRALSRQRKIGGVFHRIARCTQHSHTAQLTLIALHLVQTSRLAQKESSLEITLCRCSLMNPSSLNFNDIGVFRLLNPYNERYLRPFSAG